MNTPKFIELTACGEKLSLRTSAILHIAEITNNNQKHGYKTAIYLSEPLRYGKKGKDFVVGVDQTYDEVMKLLKGE